VKIRSVHHILLCYAEWCCHNNLPWPKLCVVAADCAWDQKAINHAFADLLAWGLINIRYCGTRHIKVLRLGDGRQTAEVTHQIPAIHRGRVGLGACYIPHDDERIAA
jgi:hypothetical protein